MLCARRSIRMTSGGDRAETLQGMRGARAVAERTMLRQTNRHRASYGRSSATHSAVATINTTQYSTVHLIATSVVLYYRDV